MTGRHTIKRLIGGLVAALVVLLAAGWIAFVPSAQEPGYEFVKAWGEKGDQPGQFNDPTGVAVAGGEVFVAGAYLLDNGAGDGSIIEND